MRENRKKNMALKQVIELHLQNQTQSFLLDSLYCEEKTECFDEPSSRSRTSLFPLVFEQDLFWEDDELTSLFIKQKETHCSFNAIENNPFLSQARKTVVEWILKVNSYYGFSALTAILAINYLDRFLSSLHYQKDKQQQQQPWMIQLAAVTCLSLASKVEEIDVPLLLDLQVEDAAYVFESKTIQRMELLVLSTLKWRMNPVTPLSFFDHIIRRLGLKHHLHWDFLRRCETMLLSVIADARCVRYLPSILATATMLHVIHQVEPCKAIDYQNQLLDVLKISKDKVNSCYEFIAEHAENNPHKRKRNQDPCSPSGVINAFFSSDSSNDSSSSHSSVPKRSRVSEQQMRLPSLSCRAFVDGVGSPR